MPNDKPLPIPRCPLDSVGGATVIGLGGIGRQIAMQLAALGVPRLQLVDPGVVSKKNHASEGYLHEDAGRPRVQATAHWCHQINPMLDINAVPRRAVRGADLGEAVFCCHSAGPDWQAAACRASRDVVVVACDVQAATVRFDFVRGLGEPGTRLTDSHLLVPQIRHPVVPIQVATVAAGLCVDLFVRFQASGSHCWAARFDLDTLHLDLDRRT